MQYVIFYCRPRHTGHPSQIPQFVPAVYKIDIHVNESDAYKPLSITHSPTPPANTALSYKLQVEYMYTQG